MNPGGRPVNDTLTTLGLAGLVGVVAVAGMLRLAGTVTAFVTGGPRPNSGATAGLRVLTNPGQPGESLGVPGMNPVAFWAVVALFVAIAGTVTWGARRLLVSMGAPVVDPRRLPGTANRGEVARVASVRALRRRGTTLRPSLAKPRPAEVGYRLGSARGRPVWASVEDSMLLIGPPRSGKGLSVVIPAILDAPGAVVTTSTRPDNVATTLTAREKAGPVAVFDPQHLAPGLPAGLRWSPVRGCERPLTAMIRATGLAASTGLNGGGVENGGFWEGQTRIAVQALLHAAALDGRDAAAVYQWALNPAAAADAVRILHTAPQAAAGWADSLDAMSNADPRTRDSIWHGVRLAFAALADPRVLDSVTPRRGEAFDPETFLRDNGTLYLLATGAGAGNAAPLVSAFIEDLTETARTIAARSPGARLDPPVLMALDEIGNLAPLPSLPTLVAEGGGSGITTLTVLQSLAQARTKWGGDAATAIWDASIVKIILGGAANSRDLQDLSALIGDRDDTTTSVTIDGYGTRSHQRSARRLPIMPTDVLRTLPFGTGVILLRAMRPMVADLRPWTRRPDARALEAQRAGVEDLIRTGHQPTGRGRAPRQ